MKKFLCLFIAMIMLAACGGKAEKGRQNEENSLPFGEQRVMILYFTHHGGTYTPEGIVDLQEGNTELMAKKIQAHLGQGDLFRIEAAKDYPTDYKECCDVAKVELEKQARPALKGVVENLSDYDIIFIGYPIWWGTYPMPVATFIDECGQAFNGKVVIPFSTNEGSDWGESLTDLKKALPGSEFRPGLALRGSKVKTSDDEINGWLDKLTEK